MRSRLLPHVVSATVALLIASALLTAPASAAPVLPDLPRVGEAVPGRTGASDGIRFVPEGPAASPAPEAEPAATATVPDRVTSVSATAIGSVDAHLRWTAPAANGSPLTGYHLQLLRDGVVVDETTWDTPETAVWITGLIPDTTYAFRLAAINAVGPGEWSAPFTFTTRYSSVERIFGADRYETSVRVSADAFVFSGIEAAFVAGGRNFPDALAAAAAAGAFGGPVLLTQPKSLSAAALAELRALEPSYVFGAGGAAVISRTVFAQAASAATVDSYQFEGANRYDTAAQMTAFWKTSATVYLASGTNFPDALAGAASAGFRDALVLLTRQNALPAETSAALKRLRPSRIIALGGTGAISDSVLRAARSATGRTTSAERWSGASRYDTAVTISKKTFTTSRVPVVYVASGRTFADALSAAAAGGASGGPVLLTLPGSISPATIAEIKRLDPERVVILGGPAVVSESVLAQVRKAITR